MSFAFGRPLRAFLSDSFARSEIPSGFSWIYVNKYVRSSSCENLYCHNLGDKQIRRAMGSIALPVRSESSLLMKRK